MAVGKLGGAISDGSADQLIYTVPAGKVATLNILACSLQTSSGVALKISVGSGASSAPGDTVYNLAIQAKETIEVSGLVCSAGEKVWVHAADSLVAIRVNGFEE